MINTNLYPILNTCTYLNTANSGILSKPIQEWRSKHDADFLMAGSNFRLQHASIFPELKQNLSMLFGADAEQIFLVPNFSFGFNTLLDGLDKSHRFLLLDEDYPSVNYPVRGRKFDHTTVPISKNLEDDILAAIKRFKPSVFAFSIVQYISGIRLSPDFIKTIKQTYPNLLLIADGTQFCGTASFNFETSGLDAILSSGYKWMLGGFGNGFVLLSDQLKDQLFQERKQTSLPTENFLENRDHLSLCFEPGHLDSLNFGSLNQGVEQLQSLGLDNIEKMTQSICTQARAEFHSRGLLSTEMPERNAQSTIMSLPLTSAVCEKLLAAKIIFSNRGAGSRFSFHFYNTNADLNHLLAVLDGKS
ncbi:aminotransferase class V-fold PLP-dependent enzyme [Pedobacter nyackensis]|uniref:Selenocysteine lyase/Cysteine desulfurase n=1 Tax=Pedobacter nyackensis TaxID=475255 RepID=A0A1W2F6Q3_9SPHI|nr:aminotransferase class V-fold PLP-dependent enzyme [Pedobacter nyackensis]SMD17228.1 Selenocysteine lyase/Cysteine desulfurase [Pedobacter nyackensis]